MRKRNIRGDGGDSSAGGCEQFNLRTTESPREQGKKNRENGENREEGKK